MSHRSFERTIRLSLAVRHWTVTVLLVGSAIAFFAHQFA